MNTWLKFQLTNIRFYFMVLAALITVGVWGWVVSTTPGQNTQLIKLNQLYGLISVVYLYLSLVGSPLYKALPILPFKGHYFKAARAIGVSAFIFALLHTLVSFFGQLQGFAGLSFLSDRYLLSLGLGFIALLILTLLASTSFDYVVDKLGFERWKKLHKIVYFCGLLIVIHTLMLGSHFINLSAAIPKIFFLALTILLLLEGYRIDRSLEKKFQKAPGVGFGLFLAGCLIAGAGYYMFQVIPNNQEAALSIHGGHGATPTTASAQNNQYNGERLSRYYTELDKPDLIYPDQDTLLQFRVFFSSNGESEVLFAQPFAKPMHVILVSEDLSYFQHLHPVQATDVFNLNLKFPKSGEYRLYTDFQPQGANEQQFAYKIRVQGSEAYGNVKAPTSYPTEATVDGYAITLNSTELRVKELNQGLQKISFTIKDAGGQPVTDLWPYLNAFGHLTLIDMDTHQYVHLHPTNFQAVKPDARGGPVVDFVNMIGYQTINQGVYKAFVEFNPGNKIIVGEFYLLVK